MNDEKAIIEVANPNGDQLPLPRNIVPKCCDYGCVDDFKLKFVSTSGEE